MASRCSESATEPIPSLTGLLKCEHCGIPMVPMDVGTEGAALQYVCPATTDKGQVDCLTPWIRTMELDRIVLERLTQHLLKEEVAPDLIAAVKEDATRRIRQETAELEREQEALKNLSDGKEELLQKVENGDFPFQEVKHLVGAAGVAVQKREARAKAINDRLSAHQRATTDDDWIIERARDTEGHIKRTSATSRIRLIQLLVNEITLKSRAITVSYSMPVFDNRGRLPKDREEIDLCMGPSARLIG